jgi:AraC-like DNA-binding protein
MDIIRSNELHFKILESEGIWSPDLHLHNFCEIYLLLEGEVEIYVHDSHYHILPGTLMLFNDREIHKAEFKNSGTYKRCYIHIPPALLHHYSTPITDLTNCFYNRNLGIKNMIQLEPSQIKYFMQNIYGMVESQQSEPLGYDLLIHSYLIQLLVMVNALYTKHSFTKNLTDKYPALIKKIISYIDNHLLDELTLEQIAHGLSLDKYYMCHIFKKETSTTIFRFILLKRIALSRILLAEGKNVTEACYLSGFKDYNNFITSFRKSTGCTPKKYQDMLKLK